MSAVPESFVERCRFGSARFVYRTKRPHGETLTTDGPFVETKEALDGYFVLEADGLDRAIEVASRVPAAGMGGAIEIRPITDWTQR